MLNKRTDQQLDGRSVQDWGSAELGRHQMATVPSPFYFLDPRNKLENDLLPQETNTLRALSDV